MGQNRNVFSIRWGLEYPADTSFLGMIAEKVDVTLRRLRTDAFELERIIVSVLGVCEEVIEGLLHEDGESTFRVDMVVLANRVQFSIKCHLDDIPADAATGTFRPHGMTARSLELESLDFANESMDDVEGELTDDGTLTLTLTRILPEDSRRDPPMYG